MICANCGKELESGVTFCPACGSKVEDMMNLRRKSAAVSDVFGSSVTETAAYRAPVTAPMPEHTAKPAAPAPEPTPAPEAEETGKQKEFFGWGGLIACLIVIALLAGTSGAFAYLYFSLLGAL